MSDEAEEGTGQGICEHLGTSVRWAGRARLATFVQGGLGSLAIAILAWQGLSVLTKQDQIITSMSHIEKALGIDETAQGATRDRITLLESDERDIYAHLSKNDHQIAEHLGRIRCIEAGVTCRP
jgi:hypothetical protein